MEIERRINEIEELMHRKISMEKKLEEANVLMIYLKEKRKELHNKLEEEDINVRNIEKQSILFLWYDLFTSKGKNISKTEHDYKIISNLYDLLNSEIVELKNKVSRIYEYDEEYKILLKEKEELVLENEKEKYEKIKKVDYECKKYKNHIRDINEAINTCNQLKNSLKYLVDLLNKSKEWDTFDIFGRGLFLSIAKSSIFKQTEDKIKNLHYLANKLTRELKVINFYMDLKMDITNIIKFSDYFIDELYYDISDKTRILNTIDYINKGFIYVDDINNYLNLHKENYLQELINLESEKHKIIK